MRKEKLSSSSSLGAGAVQLTLSKVISLAVSMLTTALLSYFRTYTEYGTYSQLLLVVNLFSSLFMLGLPSSINYFLARAETQAERQRFLSVYYTLSTLLSLVMGGALPDSELYQLNEQYHYGFCYESCRGQAHFQEFCGYLKQAFSQKMENGQVSYQPVPELFTDFRYDSLARQLESIFQELTEG